MPRWADTVRIRHLIHHTSGLPDDPELRRRIGTDDEPRWDSPAVLRALTTCLDLRFRPGSRYQYCNAGYISLVAIIERIANAPFIDLTPHTLFLPLGMQYTRFCDNADTLPVDAATGRPTPDDKRNGQFNRPDEQSPSRNVLSRHGRNSRELTHLPNSGREHPLTDLAGHHRWVPSTHNSHAFKPVKARI
jgi:CubicO group peptidase (beta-lactamase class C family)